MDQESACSSSSERTIPLHFVASFPHCLLFISSLLRRLVLPSRMSRSRAPSSRWTNLSEELEQLLADVPKLTIEEHREWRELANMMQNVMAPLEAFFQIIFGEVGKVYAVKWNDVLDGV
ncbi:hypothetical protein HKD37_11G031841 [Glycine soja]